MTQPTVSEDQSQRVQHDAPNLRAYFLTLAAVAAGTVASAAGAIALVDALGGHARALELVRAHASAPDKAELQLDPHADMQALREAAQRQLASYGWVDRRAGVVRIPIDVAMDRLVARGFPAAAPAGERGGRP